MVCVGPQPTHHIQKPPVSPIDHLYVPTDGKLYVRLLLHVVCSLGGKGGDVMAFQHTYSSTRCGCFA